MSFLLAMVLGLGFGAGDQYIGSLGAGWPVTLSLLSAPWLIWPFMFGCSQCAARRAAACGLVATLAGLCGYFFMVMGPFEGGRSSFTIGELYGLVVSNRENIVGGFVAGPLYGFLGQRWRTRRAWYSALAVAGALCLEPLALTLAGRTWDGESRDVWVCEIALGVASAIYFAWAVARSDRLAAKEPGS